MSLQSVTVPSFLGIWITCHVLSPVLDAEERQTHTEGFCSRGACDLGGGRTAGGQIGNASGARSLWFGWFGRWCWTAEPGAVGTTGQAEHSKPHVAGAAAGGQRQCTGGHRALLWSLCLLGHLQRLPAIYRTHCKPLEPGVTTQYDLPRPMPASRASALTPFVLLVVLPGGPWPGARPAHAYPADGNSFFPGSAQSGFLMKPCQIAK